MPAQMELARSVTYLVPEHPPRAGVLDRLRIDSCGPGERAILAPACAMRGLGACEV